MLPNAIVYESWMIGVILILISIITFIYYVKKIKEKKVIKKPENDNGFIDWGIDDIKLN